MKFSNFLIEKKEKSVVMAFGRFNPVTVGHEKLVNKVIDIAKKIGAPVYIVLSHSQDNKKNPLTPQQKLKYAKKSFPGVNVLVSDKQSPNFLSQASKLYEMGFTHFHMVGGQDRVEEYNHLLKKYNKIKGPHGYFNFSKIDVHSAGDRDPDAEGVEGMSASKMREFATKNDFEQFKKGVPSRMGDSYAKEMFNDVRRAMHIKEEVDTLFENFLLEGVHDQSIFKAVFLAGGPGSGKDYVMDNTLAGHGLTEINSDKALEFLMDKEGLDKTMPKSEEEVRNFVRKRAKNITELRNTLALLGRNGLIINGTGDDPEKYKKIKEKLEKLGYETSMLLVNTNDEVSKQRNIERGQRGGRTVPEDIRSEKWNSVQAARVEYAKMFGDSYKEYDNSDDLRTAPEDVKAQKKEELLSLFTNFREFTSKPTQNEIANNWIAKEMAKKDTLPVPKGGAEMTAHPDSSAAEQARKLGLKYYGFGRYGKDGKVTHRSVHDNLVELQVTEEKLNSDFEEFMTEDLRKWFDKDHPEGGWKRINSKGEAIGPCAREPGEPKPKCMSNEKRAKLSKKERAAAVKVKRKHDPDAERKGSPINVSNFGKGKLSESFNLSDSSSLNLLLLGNEINEVDILQNLNQENEDNAKYKLHRDKNGKLRTFMLRSAAAKEAHTKNGTVLKYKNGYVIKIKEENENDQVSNESIQEERNTRSTETTRSFGDTDVYQTGRKTYSIESHSSGTTTGSRKEEVEQLITEQTEERKKFSGKITIQEIYSRKKINESIDKGIEPGLSMASSGENMQRKTLKTKMNKKPFEEAIGAGGEDINSMSAKKEDDLKKVGISLSSFKAKRTI